MIELDEESGLDLAKQLENVDPTPAIIFATAYDEYALQAFEANTFDYILKPFDEKRIEKMLDKFMNLQKIVKEEMPPANELTTDYNGRFPIIVDERIVLLSQDEIIYLETSDGKVKIKTINHEYKVDETLVSLEKKLHSKKFLRVHRSFIVNMEYIAEIQPWFNSTYNLVMKDQSKVPVSRTYVKDAKPVAFGAMLVECIVAVMALVAAVSLEPADYFAINSSPEKYAELGMEPVHLAHLEDEVNMDLEGRKGGAVTLAVGMTYIFKAVPIFENLAAYFYQFVILFEAVFILTAIDAGTRTARYLIQDFFGNFIKPLKRMDSIWANITASAIACFAWGYLLFSGDISSVWALFGVSNQLMASIGLIIGATVILKIADKRWYMLTCLIPLIYLYVTVNVAGFWMIKNVYLNSANAGYNVINGVLSVIMLVLGIVIMVSAITKWAQLWKIPQPKLVKRSKSEVA